MHKDSWSLSASGQEDYPQRTNNVKGQAESKRHKDAPVTNTLTWVTAVSGNKHMTAKHKLWPHLQWFTAQSGPIQIETPAESAQI